MQFRSFCLLIYALALSLTLSVALSLTSRAQVALKPTGQGGAPLRMKALRATVTIRATQFATTDLDMRFQNDSRQQLEADFMYTVPDGAVVTDFAYFAGEERVPARVAEKARAAEIYRSLTHFSHDPALVEMVGKNTFRARVFPVFPNADLRVQIRYTQALPVARDGSVTYRLPLASGAISASLDDFAVDVQATGLESGTRVDNNLGASMTAGLGTARLAFTDRGFHAPENLALRIRPPQPPRGLTARMVAAPSGGQDGFFALALSSPAKSLTAATKFAIAGVPIYDTETTRLGEGLLVCGRYRGAGRGRLLGSISALSNPDSTRQASCMPVPPAAPATRFLTFGGAMEANNPASKLWAAARIARLSMQDKNREAVVALSERFTLPSKWTSWIAIPAAERERLARAAEAAAVERQFTVLCDKAVEYDMDPQRCAQYREQLVKLISKRTPNREQASDWHDDFLNRFDSSIYNALVDKLGHHKAAGDTTSASYRALRTRALAFDHNHYHSLDKDVEDEEYAARMQRLIVLESQGQWDSPEDRENWKRVEAYFDATMKQEEASMKTEPVGFRTSRRRETFEPISGAVANRIARLAADGETESPRSRALRARLKVLVPDNPDSRWNGWQYVMGNGVSYESEQLEGTIDKALTDRYPNTKEAHVAWERLKRLERVAPSLYRSDNKVGSVEPGTDLAQARGANDWVRGNLDSDRFAQLLTLVAEDRTHTTEYLTLRSQLAAIFSPNEVDELARTQAPDFLDHLAEEIVDGAHGLRIGWRGGDYRAFEAWDGDKAYKEHDWQDSVTKLSPEMLAHYHAQLDRIAAYTKLSAEDALLKHEEPWIREQMFRDRTQVIAALKSADPAAIQAAQSHFVDAARSPGQGPFAEQWKFFEGKNTPEGRAAFAKDRVDRLAAEVGGDRLDAELADKPNPADLASLRARRDALRAEERRLRVRMGDPLVVADFPADAQNVVALLPDGTTLPMRFDTANHRWQARFDVSTTAHEGTYVVTVVARLADGTRRTQTFTYCVDVTAPHAVARAIRTATGELRLEVDAEEDAARVDAFWSGGAEPVALSQVVFDSRGHFFAVLSPAQAARLGNAPVTITVTDHAHNRTTLTVVPPSGPAVPEETP